MDALAPADVLLFEGFRLDRSRGCLLKQDEDGAWRPVALGSRALDVLAILADRQGALVSKDETRPGLGSLSTTTTSRFRSPRCAASWTAIAPRAATFRRYPAADTVLSHR